MGTTTGFDERAAMDFVLTLRKRWADVLYPALEREYDDAVTRRGQAPHDGREAIPVVRDLPLYPWFSWIERGQQKMMWRAVSDDVERRWDELSRQLTDLPAPPVGSLTLAADLELPTWYTAYDIHLQPGGVWSDDTSAFVYEQGAQIVMLRDNDEYRFHTLFTETAVVGGPHRRIADLGCGFGKSTRPFVDAFPDAEVWGVDLSAPVLKLAHATAERMGKAIRFKQADARHTGLEAGTFDVVTGTMVLHEMPPTAVAETIQEAARLLRPGGTLRFLEFATTGDAFRDANMYEHGERNNEPFMPALFDADVLGMCEKAGLSAAGWTPFDERERGMSPQGWGERPEWHFPWAVLSAEKSAAA